jgi:plastocyanin
MKILTTLAISTAMAGAWLFMSADATGQDTCDRGGMHTIQVSEGADGKPLLKYKGESAENVYVCDGDTVRWVLTGSDREYFVDFMDNAPFSGDSKRRSNGGAVSVTIKAEPDEYDYGVNFEGDEPMDPRLIVER